MADRMEALDGPNLHVRFWQMVKSGFVLQRASLDPASPSAAFVATLVDVTGLVVYFAIASAIRKSSLL
jgi:hypothetical protein